MRSLYDILNVRPASDTEAIKASYRRLAKEYHPDKGGDPQLFREIRQAYEVLSDPALRKEYDERRSWQFSGEIDRRVTSEAIFETTDIFDDIIDIISRRFGMENTREADIEIVLTPLEASEGIELEVEIPLEQTCAGCFGFGGTAFSTCRVCGGNGVIRMRKIVHLSIPPGAQSGDYTMINAKDLCLKCEIVIADNENYD